MFISCFCGCCCSHSWFFYFYYFLFIYLLFKFSSSVCVSELLSRVLSFYSRWFHLGEWAEKGFSLQFKLISRISELTQVSFAPEQDVTSPDFTPLVTLNLRSDIHFKTLSWYQCKRKAT